MKVGGQIGEQSGQFRPISRVQLLPVNENARRADSLQGRCELLEKWRSLVRATSQFLHNLWLPVVADQIGKLRQQLDPTGSAEASHWRIRRSDQGFGKAFHGKPFRRDMGDVRVMGLERLESGGFPRRIKRQQYRLFGR